MALQTTLAVLLFAVAARGNILVNIQAGLNEDTSAVDYFGESSGVITDGERNIFQLSDTAIRQGILNHHNGNSADVFLHDPTGKLGNLYRQYNWAPTTTVLKPVAASVVNATSVPVAVLTQTFTNDHPTLSATFNVELTQQIQNTVSTSWSSTTQKSASQSINFNIQGFSAGAGFNFVNTWGRNALETETVVIGTRAGLQVTLRPRESITAELIATRGNLRVDIDYEATLTGRIVANYPKKHEGHHFWAYDVNSILASADLTQKIEARETVNLGLYSEGQVRISDGRTKKFLGIYAADMKVVKA